jgi:hypothetical protein
LPGGPFCCGIIQYPPILLHAVYWLSRRLGAVYVNPDRGFQRRHVARYLSLGDPFSPQCIRLPPNAGRYIKFSFALISMENGRSLPPDEVKASD